MPVTRRPAVVGVIVGVPEGGGDQPMQVVGPQAEEVLPDERVFDQAQCRRLVGQAWRLARRAAGRRRRARTQSAVRAARAR